MSESQPMPPPNFPPSQKRKRKWLKPTIAAVAVALAFFIGIGAGASAVEPEVVTKEVEVEVERVVEKEVPVEVEVEVPITPTECREALDYADEGFGIASEQMGYMLDVINAVSDLDVTAIEEANANMEPLTDEMDTLAVAYNEAKAACRAG